MSTEFLPSNEDETVLRRENELYQESYRTIQVVSDILEDIIKLNHLMQSFQLYLYFPVSTNPQ